VAGRPGELTVTSVTFVTPAAPHPPEDQ